MFKLVVLFSVLALAAAKPWVGPVVHSSGVIHGSAVVPSVYSPLVSSYGVVPAVAAVAQAPNSPAVVLDAVNGVPLDTPEVVAARLLHHQAKALSGVHALGKRSVLGPVAPLAPVVAVNPLVSSVVSPVAYGSPHVVGLAGLAHSAVLPAALSVHPW